MLCAFARMRSHAYYPANSQEPHVSHNHKGRRRRSRAITPNLRRILKGCRRRSRAFVLPPNPLIPLFHKNCKVINYKLKFVMKKLCKVIIKIAR